MLKHTAYKRKKSFASKEANNVKQMLLDDRLKNSAFKDFLLKVDVAKFGNKIVGKKQKEEEDGEGSMDELVKGGRQGASCPSSNQTLWGLGQAGACGSFCCLLVATMTNYWLKTWERSYTFNGTVYYQIVYSGLWKRCSEDSHNYETILKTGNV
ncbi:hypothetical protein HELRODRAFT_162783 [Helobdella robusta]|uniref:Uncharacterized protein n=1 Tax=Helobdella robusta TaxID=6412 RepID=T1ET50_HELRO|nr:hypothetical protein HELRODRAFT_162783 [Helobdella robusta]ESN99265.1 hypothetical protein HELRODRAFT_162783 [Helobdella robusta]